MDPAEAAPRALAFTVVIAAVIVFVWFGATETVRATRAVCICAHPPRRHTFRAGRCFDCRCQHYIDAPGPKYDE